MWVNVCHPKKNRDGDYAATSSIDVKDQLVDGALLAILSLLLAVCLLGSLPNMTELAPTLVSPPKRILCWHINSGHFRHLKDIHFLLDKDSVLNPLWNFLSIAFQRSAFLGGKRLDLSAFGPNVSSRSHPLQLRLWWLHLTKIGQKALCGKAASCKIFFNVLNLNPSRLVVSTNSCQTSVY